MDGYITQLLFRKTLARYFHATVLSSPPMAVH